MPHGAQVQARPGSEAQDPAPGTVPAAASGRPLPHRGVPRGDLRGEDGRKTSWVMLLLTTHDLSRVLSSQPEHETN